MPRRIHDFCDRPVRVGQQVIVRERLPGGRLRLHAIGQGVNRGNRLMLDGPDGDEWWRVDEIVYETRPANLWVGLLSPIQPPSFVE
jgi:hypothetical protein